MNNNIKPLENPCNATERYLHAVCIRLDALIHIGSSLVEYLANQNNIAVTNNEVKTEEVVEPVKKRTKK